MSRCSPARSSPARTSSTPTPTSPSDWAKCSSSTGKNRDKVEQLNAGQIGALVKLKNTHTGNTLTSPKRKVTVPPIEYPNPSIHEALKPKNKGDEDKIAIGLAALHEEDPSFQYHVDSELHQTVISGQGELHLQVAMERVKERFNIEIELSAPKDSHSAKPSGTTARRSTVTKNRAAAPASSPRCGCASSPHHATMVWSSPTPSSARTWTACSCPPSRKASTAPAPTASSPATAWST